MSRPPVKNRARICPGCGTLLDPSDSTCFQCGAEQPSAPARGIRTWFEGFQLQGEVTRGILFVTIFIFVITWIASEMKGKSDLLMSIDGDTLYSFGAKSTAQILTGEIWRLVTPIFLHANFLHILFNMWAFVQLGNLAEEIYGWQRYLFFYVVTGAIGYAASMLFYPQVLSIGASGAIMGLMGVLLAYSARNWKTYGKLLGKSLIFWAVFILGYGFILPGLIDNAAHIGGLLSGFIIALPFTPGPPKTRGAEIYHGILGWGAMLIVLWSFLAMGFSR